MSNTPSHPDLEKMYKAVIMKNLKEIQQLIKCGADVKEEIFMGMTLLHVAAQRGNVEVIQCLIKHGASVMAKDFIGLTPLHNAAQAGNIEVIQCLIKHGADVMAEDGSFCMPLHCAAELGNLEAVQCLIKHGADVKEKHFMGRMLHMAARNGNIDVIQCLIKHGANVKEKIFMGETSLLHVAAQHGNKEVILCLIKHGASVKGKDILGRTLLHIAAREGSIEVIQCLIKHGADVMANDRFVCTPLHCAAESGNLEAVQYLIKHGADVMAKNDSLRTPLHYATHGRNLEAVQCLIKHDADVMARDNKGKYPWIIACEKQYCEIMLELLKGADLKQKLHNGMSFLHLSCLSGSIRCAEYLLENGVDVNCTDENNLTPLFAMFVNQDVPISSNSCLAEEEEDDWEVEMRMSTMDVKISKNSEFMKLLADSGAHVNHRDKDGHTLLMKRNIYKQKDKRELLLQHGADINAVGCDGLTVLWIATEYDCEAEFYLIDDLLARNMDIGLSRYKYDGMTPLQLAYSKRNYELCHILLDARCSLRNMLEFMDANVNLESDENIQQVRNRILELSCQPYSLQELSRQAVLRVMGQGNLVEKVYCMKENKILPIMLLNFLIRNLGFEID